VHPDIHLIPQSEDGTPLELSIRANPALVAAGWTRRQLADPFRAKETTELYQSLGFEVKSCKPTPDDFGPKCKDCAEAACRAYVLIYTRRKPRAAGACADQPTAETDHDEARNTV
jgi:hypothetical protein